RRREEAERARWLRRSLEGMSEGLDRPLDPQRVTDAAQRRSNDWIDPALRLVARCLREIGPERLAAIRRDHRVVWATDPTPVQRPLGAAARAAMRLLVDEQKTFGDALRKP